MTKPKPKSKNTNFTAGVSDEELQAAVQEEQTIHLSGIIDPEEPTLAGFAVADDPGDLPAPADALAAATSPAENLSPPPNVTSEPLGHSGEIQPKTENSAAPSGEPLGYSGLMNSMARDQTFTQARNAMAKAASRTAAALDGEILGPDASADPSTIRYESRIRILEAYPYTGSVADAPEFVDRNWVGWSDYDPVRQMEPGPCLRVPDGDFSVTICRPGDYVVKQQVMLDVGVPGHENIEVWEGAQFRRLFVATPVDS